MNKYAIDVLGINHSVTVVVQREGTKEQVRAKILSDGGFEDENKNFYPYQTIMRISAI